MATSPTSPWPGRRLAPYVSTTPTHNLDLSLDSLSTPAFPSSGPSNLHPPDYDSIQTPSTSAIQASQASRNLEKQALRDAWREQALAQHHRGSAPRSVAAPPSIEPSSDSNSSGEHRVGLGISQGRRSPPRSDTSDTQKRSGSTGILPEGMEVHEALAKCEDPTLGWSLRFWVTIADPVTNHVFFACPGSGQCSWEPPVGAFVVPRSPNGEWWELADATRSNRSYYYNTLTKRTQWTRPGGEAFVIPLGLIQSNGLPSRSAASLHTSARHSSGSIPSFTHNTAMTTPPRKRERSSNVPSPVPSLRADMPRPPPSPRMGIGSLTAPHSVGLRTNGPVLAPVLASPPADHVTSGRSFTPTAISRSLDSERRIPSDPLSLASQSTDGSRLPRTPLSIVERSHLRDTSWSDARSSNDPPQLKDGGLQSVNGAAVPEHEQWHDLGDSSKGSPLAKTTSDTSGTRNQGIVGLIPVKGAMPPGKTSAEPIFVDSRVRSKHLSSGWHPVLAGDISADIQNFQTDEFAEKYFATKREGMLRLRVPLERIMEWQKSPITSPLLLSSKSLTKDSNSVFKVIQHVMGERDRPVASARSAQGSSTALSLASLNLGGRKNDQGHMQKTGRLSNGMTNGGANGLDGGARSEKMVVLDEIRWMIQLAVSTIEMRDEIYSQIIKQVTRNPDHDAMVLGFQLLCVVVHAFGASKDFAPFVRSFLQRNFGEQEDGIGVMAQYCLTKLDVLAMRGGRCKVLTIGEIEHASDAAFYPSVYGECLDRIMQLQASSYPDLKVPVILPFLADGILALGGTSSEGIFRVPGDTDSINELKCRIDRGHYQLIGINDPHVAASLFKLWLRELEHPVVPTELYNEALAASYSADESTDFVTRLPTFNRRVLLFVISFFQQFMRDEVLQVTKMTPQNLALVLAPNILRTTSNHLETVFTNASFESKFVLQLLENLKPRDLDYEYVPTHGPAVESGRLDRGYHGEI